MIVVKTVSMLPNFSNLLNLFKKRPGGDLLNFGTVQIQQQGANAASLGCGVAVVHVCVQCI